MNILMISQYYHPEPCGTAPYATDMAEWICRKGHKVTVITGLPFYPEAAVQVAYRKQLWMKECVNGILVLRAPTYVPRRNSGVERAKAEGIYVLSQIPRIISQLVELRRVDAVISICPSIFSCAIGVVLAYRHGAHHVAHIHDLQSGLASSLGIVKHNRLVKVLASMERAVLRRVHRVYALTPEMSEHLRKLTGRQPGMLPVWIDTARNKTDDTSLRAQFDLPSDSFLAMYAGAVGRKQGLDTVMDAAVRLVENPRVKFVISGSGNYRSHLIDRAKAEGLVNVRFYDAWNDEDFLKFISCADLHLIPQDPAGSSFAFPSKTLRVMSIAKPFVTTATPASPLGRLCHESKGGIRVDPGDSEALASTIEKYCEDPVSLGALGQAGRSHVLNTYESELVLGAFFADIEAASR